MLTNSRLTAISKTTSLPMQNRKEVQRKLLQEVKSLVTTLDADELYIENAEAILAILANPNMEFVIPTLMQNMNARHCEAYVPAFIDLRLPAPLLHGMLGLCTKMYVQQLLATKNYGQLHAFLCQREDSPLTALELENPKDWTPENGMLVMPYLCLYHEQVVKNLLENAIKTNNRVLLRTLIACCPRHKILARSAVIEARNILLLQELLADGLDLELQQVTDILGEKDGADFFASVMDKATSKAKTKAKTGVRTSPTKAKTSPSKKSMMF